jgi:hypothetical protein
MRLELHAVRATASERHFDLHCRGSVRLRVQCGLLPLHVRTDEHDRVHACAAVDLAAPRRARDQSATDVALGDAE